MSEPVKTPQLLLSLSEKPGPCVECRHANQATLDFAEGYLHCGEGGGSKTRDSLCTVERPGMRSFHHQPEMFFLFEPYTGTNGTWGVRYHGRLLAPGADDDMRRAIRADEPVLFD